MYKTYLKKITVCPFCIGHFESLSGSTVRVLCTSDLRTYLKKTRLNSIIRRERQYKYRTFNANVQRLTQFKGTADSSENRTSLKTRGINIKADEKCHWKCAVEIMAILGDENCNLF